MKKRFTLGPKLPLRLAIYFAGLLIMTLGIAISVKSDLGVSPVSSIPYTMTCVWGIEMGFATILFHCALILVQVVLLRCKFNLKNLLQLPVGIVFGYFTTFCNWLMSLVYIPDILGLRILMMLVSTLLLTIGIFWYVPTYIMPLAGEGAMLAISNTSHIEFSKVKIGFDTSMVLISLVTCLALIGNLGSVGAGTIAAAFLVGAELKVITKFFGHKRDRILGLIPEVSDKAE